MDRQDSVGGEEPIKFFDFCLKPVGGIGAGFSSAIREGRAVGCKVEG